MGFFTGGSEGQRCFTLKVWRHQPSTRSQVNERRGLFSDFPQQKRHRSHLGNGVVGRVTPKWWRGMLVLQYIPEYHTQLAKMSFDKMFDLTAGVYFYFYNIPGAPGTYIYSPLFTSI